MMNDFTKGADDGTPVSIYNLQGVYAVQFGKLGSTQKKKAFWISFQDA
jgi:hypothetical protein